MAQAQQKATKTETIVSSRGTLGAGLAIELQRIFAPFGDVTLADGLSELGLDVSGRQAIKGDSYISNISGVKLASWSVDLVRSLIVDDLLLEIFLHTWRVDWVGHCGFATSSVGASGRTVLGIQQDAHTASIYTLNQVGMARLEKNRSIQSPSRLGIAERLCGPFEEIAHV